MEELIYRELSYKLINISYKVYNSMGCGFHEKYFQR
jgi:hypothetical protein